MSFLKAGRGPSLEPVLYLLVIAQYPALFRSVYQLKRYGQEQRAVVCFETRTYSTVNSKSGMRMVSNLI